MSKFCKWYGCLTQNAAPWKFVTEETAVRAAIKLAKESPGNEDGVLVIQALGFVEPNGDEYEPFDTPEEEGYNNWGED